MMLLHAQREHGRSFSLCETFTSSARRSQAQHNKFARPAQMTGNGQPRNVEQDGGLRLDGR